MRVIDLSLLLVALVLFSQMVLGAGTTSTVAPIPAPTPTQYMPFNATNESGSAAAAAFFSIGGVVILGQIIYCYLWTKKDAEERAKFNAEIEEAGLVGGPKEKSGSAIDMRHEH